MDTKGLLSWNYPVTDIRLIVDLTHSVEGKYAYVLMGIPIYDPRAPRTNNRTAQGGGNNNNNNRGPFGRGRFGRRGRPGGRPDPRAQILERYAGLIEQRLGKDVADRLRGRISAQRGWVVVNLRSDRISINGWLNQNAEIDWQPKEVGQVVVKPGNQGGPAVWLNGRYAAGVGRAGNRKAGAVAFAFSDQVGTVDNVVIEGTLDMEWFKERTKNVR